MTATALAEALIAAGLDPAERVGKQALFTTVLRACAPLQSGAPTDVWWVPGRIEVFGKHTDYAGGRTLVCPVPRGFAVLAAPREDRTVTVTDASRGDSITLPAGTDVPPQTGWRHYVEVAVRRLARNFPGCALAADIVLASDLPPASGMSSSSALVIAVAAALAAIGGVRKHRAWQANVRTPLDAAAYYACIENGRRFGGLEGDSGVGTHGGSEDHAAIVEGRAGMVSAFGFVPPRAIDVAPMPAEWRFVVAPSDVRASKTGGVRSRYNQLSAGAGALLALWNTNHGGVAVSLAAALASERGAAEQLREYVHQSSVPGWTPDDLERRLDHFIDEDARILPAVDAFRHADTDALAGLARKSQADAERLLGNQIDETIALAKRAREYGAFAATSFGAGFGGSVWALATVDTAEQVARRWHRHAFVARPGPPITRLGYASPNERRA
ncbi:MAG TPA: galactokinase family protein [Vicinamibacterales bacterium]|nr:galactokinase family protein [Vicinamibacterales bacterium]